MQLLSHHDDMGTLLAAIPVDTGSCGGGLDIFPPADVCEELTHVIKFSGQVFTFDNFR
jgi:hypothetical protein